MTRKLDWASLEVPELRRYSDKLRGYYADLAEIGGPLPVQRVHGDYHLGQVLRTPTGWVVLDFEGEPVVPLGQRRAPRGPPPGRGGRPPSPRLPARSYPPPPPRDRPPPRRPAPGGA